MREQTEEHKGLRNEKREGIDMKGFLKGVREFGGNFVYALSLIMGASRLYFFLAALKGR